jgi:2-desacetyl-2-hydroxyethyl bacteriochlorophyllide A dehydrogenase
MKAVIFEGKLKYVRDYPTPLPGRGEALIRVNSAAICNTDLEIIKGYLGFSGILGHEFAGTVMEAGGEGRHLVGKRVVGEINCACGTCGYCLKGLRSHCPVRKTLGIQEKDGAFAEYVTLPVENLWELPDSVTDREAVFVEPLAAAFEITEQIQIKPTDKILVLGDGKLGILTALVLGLTQAEVTLAGKHDRKLEIARKQKISTVKVNNLRAERQYDIVAEATGSSAGLEVALQLVRPRGKIVLKTTVARGKEMNLAPIVIHEIAVIGSRCGPFGPALRALSRNAIDVNPLITSVYKPYDVEKAFRKAASRDSLKVILDFT